VKHIIFSVKRLAVTSFSSALNIRRKLLVISPSASPDDLNGWACSGLSALHRPHAGLIEPGLQPPSPRNGNISNIRWRLTTISRRKWPNSVSGDRPPNRKSPPFAGISGIAEGKISRRRTAWLGREDSILRMVESTSGSKARVLKAIRAFYGLTKDQFINPQSQLTVEKFATGFVTDRSRILHGTWSTLNQLV
jgi:hypothetical protein